LARELSSSGADQADARVGSVHCAMSVPRVVLAPVRLWLVFQWICAGAGGHGMGPDLLGISSLQVTMWWKACATPSGCTPHGVSISCLAEPLAR